MTIPPKVSVILTSYNHAKYIRESIESVLNQTYRDFELIIWDDASTDNSWEIISSYSDKEQIRVFRNETNQFMAYFRKAVSEVARGEYIAIHHSDDVWEIDKLEKQAAFLDAHPEIGAVFSKVLIVGENGEPFEDTSHFYYKIFDQPNRSRYEWLNHFFYQGNALCHPSVLIRKACYEDCDPYRSGFGQANDLDMWVRLCLKYEIHILQEKLVRFRVRSSETNISGFRPEAHIRGEFERFEILNNYRGIRTSEEFIKVFPNAIEYFRQQDFDIGFALGMIAVESGATNYAKLFGFQLLFEALNDADRARKIKELYRFGHNEFIALTAIYDVFSVELVPNLLAQLAQKDHDNQALLSQLHAQSSLEQSLILRLRRLRTWIAPIGGRRDKLLKMGFQGLRVWKNEGLRSVYRRVTQRIKGRISTANKGQTARSSQENILMVPPLDWQSISSDAGQLDIPGKSNPGLSPQASIIIVTYNNLNYTKLCLKSIYEKTLSPDFEVIVVDNGSTDGTIEFLRSFESQHENIQVIYNTRNEGFARANNLGIAKASGDYIVLLNNDTVVTAAWLSRLINHLQDQQVGLVGSVTNGVSNEAYVDISFSDNAALDTFAAKLAKEGANLLTPIKMLAMYCMAGRREVFQQIGPLDEQFGIGMFEDDDYSLRVRQAGYKIAVAEDVFVHHFGRSSFKILGDERYMALFEGNRNKFEAKWNIKWKQHVSGTLADNRRFTADLQGILDSYPDAAGVIIFPPTIGWNISLFQRPHQLARAFAKKGFVVFFYSEEQIDDVRGFRQVNHGLYLANCPWAVFDLIERPVVFTLPYNREYIFQLRRPLVVYEVIDDMDVFPGDKTQLQKNHEILLKKADAVIVTADKLMAQVERVRKDAILCPNAVELDHFAQARGWQPKSMPADLASIIKTDRPVIGYYGALARWFDYDLVRQAANKHSDWDFVLIGPDHDHTLMTSNILATPNIHWLGARDYSQLPDYLRHFTVATIPFLVNKITLATSPIKLFEYMAAGKPIVTSDLPECRKYPGVFVAHNGEEFIDHLEHALTLIDDSVYLQQLYQTAQENTWEVRVEQILSALVMHQNQKSLKLESRL